MFRWCVKKMHEIYFFLLDIDRPSLRQQTDLMPDTPLNLEAANDHDFHKQRHRSLPIVDTITQVPDYPAKLRIYKIPASPFWQVRCFFKGKTFTKSTRTSSKRSALSAARDFFHSKVAELYGVTLQKSLHREVLFADLVDPTVAMHQGRVDRGEYTQNSLRMMRNRLQRYVVPVLGHVPVKEFSYQHAADFMQKLSAKGNSSVTIQQYLVAIRKVLVHAMATGHITALPKFPTITIKSKPRGSFSLPEYRLLVTHARRLVGDVIPIHATQRSKYGPSRIGRYEYIKEDLQYLIVFMVNSFIRPSDLKNMKHEHVTIVRGEHVYLRLNLPESKKHDKPIVTMRPAVRAYERLLVRDLARGYGKPEDYVFMPELWDRLVMIMRYGYQLQRVQEVAGVGVNKSNGMKRTLYSLRHTSITLRLLYGGNIDLLTLARNARTSVDMIETYYSSNLTAEMNIGLLQGKRGK